MRCISMLAAGLIAQAVLPAQSDLFEWSLYAPLDAGQRVSLMAFGPDGSKGAFATADGTIQLLDLTVRPPLTRRLAQQAGRVVSLQFASDGSALMSAGEDGNVLLSSFRGGGDKSIRAKSKLLSAALSRDGELIATASDDKSVAIWDTQSGRQISQLQHKSKKPFFRLDFAEKDTSLVGVSESGTICEWDVKTRAVVRQIQDSDQAIHSASAGGGGLLSVGAESADFQKGPLGMYNTARASDMRREDRVKIYDLGRGSVAKTLDGIDGNVVSVALSGDGRFVGIIRQRVKDSFLDVYDSQRGVSVASSRLPGIGTAVAFSQSGQWLGAATDRGDVMVWAVKGLRNPVSPDALRGVTYAITSTINEPLVAPARPLTLAVMDFAANGVDSDTGRAVADMIRTRIGEGQNVRLVERSEIDRVIKEQNFQASDRVDPETAGRLGRILGASKLVLGNVSKTDTRFTISVRLVDTETGAIEGGVREITCEPCSAAGLQEAVIRLKPVLVK
ncbi:MAG TPA: CsgG/HfaB family protein [Bryobacteraceae bacterium]|nr:CsgG/HfaB family protein [Bryobacteraceae bacterium]